MSSMGTTPSDDLFDQWAASTPDDAQDSALSAPESAPASNTTPVNLRRAMQELLKHGLLEQQSKPQLFRQMLTETARINTLLEPLDLELRLDDTRGWPMSPFLPATSPMRTRVMNGRIPWCAASG